MGDGRRPRTSLERLVESLEDLLPRLDTLASIEEARARQSTVPDATLRSSENGVYLSGMFTTDANNLAIVEFTVPFAAVFFADLAANGPYDLVADSAPQSTPGQNFGPGTVHLSAGAVACRPLTGWALTVVSTTARSAFFLAIFRDPQVWR